MFVEIRNQKMLEKRIQWLYHENSKILYVDFRNLSEDKLIELVRMVDDVVVNSGERNFLKLNDVRGQFTTAKILAEIKRSSKVQNPYIKKSAYVGIVGVKKILLDAINRVSSIGAKAFIDYDEAKLWLISD
ncbi:MAG: hypothetical protein JXR51_06280 [Bacteroidales bacterium]|nr:hypothetical protein [Bacteroidales bacterium]MBN2756768.1 hypothetical protein [Bacteroidales bacterium]